MSSRTIGFTPPIELMGALLRRALFCAVISNEKAPWVRFGFRPTTLAVAVGANAQSASASNPRMSEVVLDTGQVPVVPLQIGAGDPAPHVVPAAAKASVVQVAIVPEQVS